MSLPDNYAAGSGATITGGKNAGGSMPAWMTAAGVALNKAVAIPGAAGHDGAPVHAYSGYATDLVKSRIILAAVGGHSDSNNTQCSELDLRNDTLAWERLKNDSDTGVKVFDVPYYSDGAATSVHTYDYMHFVQNVNRVIRHFIRGLWPNGGDGAVVQGFNPDSTPPAWDAAGTFTYGGAGYSPAVDHVHHKILCLGSTAKLYNPATNSYENTITGTPTARYPVAYNANDDFFFGLQWGGGESGDAWDQPAGDLRATVMPSVGAIRTITFNASAAYAQFVAEKKYPGNNNVVGYSGMCHDTANNKFYWYSGYAGRVGNLYVITPNSGSVWDMSLFNWASGSAPLPVTLDAGVNGRLKYFPLLKGFVICPDGITPYFVKTSN